MFTIYEEPMFKAGDTDEFGIVIPNGSTTVYEFLWNEKVIYVGETDSFNDRMKNHWLNQKNGTKSRIYNKIRKSLRENYEISVRIVTNCAERDTYEILRISAQKSPHLCNTTKGGDGGKLTGTAKLKHSKAIKTLNADPKFKAESAERMRLLNADPKFKAKNAERMRILNADPKFKAESAERLRLLHADPKFKAESAESMRLLHADPKFKAEHAERLRLLHADPKFKAEHAERLRLLHADPKFKAENAERMRLLNADPKFKAESAERMRILNADPIFQAKAKSAKAKKRAELNAKQ
jgi:hypothetical protein